MGWSDRTTRIRGWTLRRPARRGFTMVELVLVVSIIGVLSAIAVPRLNRAGQGADYASQHRDWQVVQKQIELYAIEHFGTFPAETGDGIGAAAAPSTFMRQMTGYSDANGVVSGSRAAPYTYGPYLREGLPAVKYGPHKGLTTVRIVTGATAPQYSVGLNFGWIYNATTGDIIPNVPQRSDLSDTVPVDFGTESVVGTETALEID